MAYLPHCAVILQGVLGSTALTPSDIWSTGHQISDTNFAALPTQAQADLIRDAWKTCFQSSTMNLCSNAFLTQVVVVAIGADGKWRKNTDGSYMKRVSVCTPPGVGVSAAVNVEYPVSSVVSLLSARAGANGRGRQYWPLPAEDPDATGHTAQSAATSRAGAVRTALNSINTALATGTYQGLCVVASSAGFNSTITGVRCGNVHDTQRRRRNALTETYSAVTVP